jgi:hypothetical protein
LTSCGGLIGEGLLGAATRIAARYAELSRIRAHSRQ